MRQDRAQIEQEMLGWRNHPVTQALQEWLSKRRESFITDLAEGSLLGGKSEELSQRYAQVVGRLEEIRVALSFDVDDVFSVIHRDSESNEVDSE